MCYKTHFSPTLSTLIPNCPPPSLLTSSLLHLSRSTFLGASLDSDLGPSAVFHPPSKETILASTSAFGPKPFLFIPQQVGLGFPLLSTEHDKDHKIIVSVCWLIASGHAALYSKCLMISIV